MKTKIMTIPSSTSCRKAVSWLQENKILFVEKRIHVNPLTREEVTKMLSLTDYGFEDLISMKSNESKKLFRKYGNIESLSTNLAIDLIINHPKILKAPIIFNDRSLCAGFNEDEIRVFISRKEKKKEFEKNYLKLGGN